MSKRFVLKMVTICMCLNFFSNTIVADAAELDTSMSYNEAAFVNDEYTWLREAILDGGEVQKENVKMTSSDRALLSMYDDYLRKTNRVMSAEEKYSIRMLEGFAEDAARRGIIENTPQAKAAISKALLRANFKLIADGGKLLGYTTAADLLAHSLQDNPSKFIYSSSSTYAQQIANSSECQSLIGIFKNKVNGTNLTGKIITGSITLNSTTDLHLAYNKVNYKIIGQKTNGRWNLSITITDVYDFETQAWVNSMTDNDLITILNNYAAIAQSQGAIVPFNVEIALNASY